MTTITIPDIPGIPKIEDKELVLNLSTPETLWINMMPPVPPKPVARLHYTALLENKSSSSKQLSSSTQCDIENWVILDSKGKVVDSDKFEEEYCTEQYISIPIEGHQTLRKDGTIFINARLLFPGEEYTLVYVWWGVIGTSEFKVNFAF